MHLSAALAGLPPDFAITVLIGLGLGIALGISGVGGGVLLTPLLILAMRVQPTVAVGTSLAFSLVTKLFGGLQHLRQGSIDRGTVLWLACGSVPAAATTALLVNTLGRGLVTDEVTRRLVLLAVLLAAVVMTARVTGVFKPRERSIGGPALIPVGAVLGVVFALTSVGSGSIAVAILVVITALPIARLVGTDVAHAAIMAAVTAPFYFAGGRVDMPLLGALLVGSIPGVVLGSRLAVLLPERVVKGVLVVAMWAVAVKLA